MSETQLSGKAFSIHPDTQYVNHLIIDLSSGERYIVDKDSFEVLNKPIKANLSDADIQTLANTIFITERAAASPIEVEWAKTDGQILILNSRPLTTHPLPPIFEKAWTRFMPLFCAEYAYHGEKKLSQLTKNTVDYEPIFVNEPKQGTSIYYVMNDPVKDVWPLIDYFTSKPEEFHAICDKYLEESKALRSYLKQGAVDFAELLTRTEKLWSFLIIVVIVGKHGEKAAETLSERALQVRAQTDADVYQADDALFEAAKRLLPEHEDLIPLLTSEEIISKHLPNEAEITLRRTGYVYCKGKLYSGWTKARFAEMVQGEFIEEELNDQASALTIKGSIAHSGIARGNVRIVNSKEQMVEFKNGEILVSWMTTPEFMSILPLASAIVTDEGGITCHAAIVARELKKPCIIGTKIATSRLKNGDFVEVDADKGEVRIIERGKDEKEIIG